MQIVFAWSLCLSVLVVLTSIVPLTLGRIKAGYSVENMSAPRALFDDLPDFGKRAVWCHQNCWESISLHAPACLLCMLTMPDSNLAIIAAWFHPSIRIFYILAYVFNIPTARGLSWASGLLSTIILYKEGIAQLF
tara:strand:- start:1413 stop:1817 length:405 start_codon:yes stop_codon:yes gene_type:complete